MFRPSDSTTNQLIDLVNVQTNQLILLMFRPSDSTTNQLIDLVNVSA